MEAAKRSFALIPKALRERVRATPVFQPAPPAPA
jgi:hypothetical protein